MRVHGNAGRRPKHQLTLQQVKDIVQFILNYTGKELHLLEVTKERSLYKNTLDAAKQSVHQLFPLLGNSAHHHLERKQNHALMM